MVRNFFKSESEKTSDRMRRIRSRGTKLEASMENILVELELSYTKQPRILGHPDFELTESHVLIFCDSSFWHGRNPNDVSGKNFQRNRKLWVEKLTKTIERDKQVNEELTKSGWKVLRFWDDEILKTPETCRNRILEKVRNL